MPQFQCKICDFPKLAVDELSHYLKENEPGLILFFRTENPSRERGGSLPFSILNVGETTCFDEKKLACELQRIMEKYALPGWITLYHSLSSPSQVFVYAVSAKETELLPEIPGVVFEYMSYDGLQQAVVEHQKKKQSIGELAFSNFENLILFLCQSLHSKPAEIITLKKLVWLIDMTTMKETGQTITGLNYVRESLGLTPYNENVLFCAMEAKGLVALDQIESHIWGTCKGLLLPQCKPFSQDNLERIRRILELHGKKKAKDLICMSQDIVWASFNDKEIVPMETYLGNGLQNNASPEREKKKCIQKMRL